MKDKISYFIIVIIVILDILLLLNTNPICESRDLFQLVFSAIIQLIIIYYLFHQNKMKDLSLIFFKDKSLGLLKLSLGFFIAYLVSMWFLWGGITGVTVAGGAYFCDGIEVYSSIENINRFEKKVPE